MIQNLFPTQIWRSNLNLEKDIRDSMFDQIEDNYKNNQDYYHPVWNCKVHSSNKENNNIDYSKLIPYFKSEYQAFTEACELKSHICRIQNMWYNYYLEGSNQEVHTHVEKNILYSAIFYLRIGEDHPLLTFYNYTNYHTLYASNTFMRDIYPQNKIANSIFYEHFTLDVKENDFVIFPAYLPHGVFVQKCKKPRITISMNFALVNDGE